MANIVLSTLSSDVVYKLYKKAPSGANIVKKEVKIIGGSNVINKALITPQGVTTSISDEDLAILEKNELFQRHLENGFVKLQKTEKANTKDMEAKDSSAQLTDADFEAKGQTPPTTNNAETKAKTKAKQ